MAVIKLFQNKSDRSIVLVPFASDHLGDRAFGKMIHFSESEFIKDGMKDIQEILDNYHSRKDYPESDLFQIMSSSARSKFMKNHFELSIFTFNDKNYASVYSIDKNGEKLVEIPYPFNPEAFCREAIELFDKYSH